MSIELLSTIWPDWVVEGDTIGVGSFGKVYKVVRKDFSVNAASAVKVISVPVNESEVLSLRADGMSEMGAKAYLHDVVENFVNEINLMVKMRGHTNIVYIEDYKVVEKKDAIGWDIFIRMELLTPLVAITTDRVLPESEVIKLGIDMCTALERCGKLGVIHRDIKPENIFINSCGDYKIGDFGVAKQLEKTTSTFSSKGTFNYMAPEVAANKKYDATVDMYSLGIVLYKLLNNNHLPFIDPYSENILYAQKKAAVDKRLSGKRFPPAVNASQGMNTIIFKACSPDPKCRFASPTAMKNALIAVSKELASQKGQARRPDVQPQVNRQVSVQQNNSVDTVKYFKPGQNVQQQNSFRSSNTGSNNNRQPTDRPNRIGHNINNSGQNRMPSGQQVNMQGSTGQRMPVNGGVGHPVNGKYHPSNTGVPKSNFGGTSVPKGKKGKRNVSRDFRVGAKTPNGTQIPKKPKVNKSVIISLIIIAVVIIGVILLAIVANAAEYPKAEYCSVYIQNITFALQRVIYNLI